MTRFVLTPLAARDLAEIWDYAQSAGTRAAERFLGDVVAAFGKLARTPGLGHLREELADRRHRFYLVYRYLIVYRPGSRPLEVIRVLHTARDVQALLKSEPGDPAEGAHRPTGN